LEDILDIRVAVSTSRRVAAQAPQEFSSVGLNHGFKPTPEIDVKLAK
jgi:hypothetical protein